MTNPFFNRGPIREPRFYFSRPRETKEVVRLLAGTQNCSLVGPVKSGKTSLLLHLARPGTLAGHGLRTEGQSAVYLSFEGLGTLAPEQFFHLMVREIAAQSSGKIALVWPRFQARDSVSFLELKEVLDQLEVAGERIIFLLDEVELAARNQAFDLNFFSALRHIAGRPEVCFVTATDCRLHELEIAGREIGSPFADLFSVVRLRPLETEAAWASLSRLSAEAGVDLESEREFILGLAGGSAYCLQVAAYEVVECKRDSAPLTEEQRHYVVSRAFEQVEPIFSIMWERLDETRRQAAVGARAGDGLAVEVDGFTSLLDGHAAPDGALAARFLEERGREQGARIEDFQAVDSPDRSAMYSVVRVLMRAVEGRDRYALGHADEVARLAAVVALEMGCSPETTEAVRIAARLHDIGRVSISDLILLKPGPLSELETEIMRTHPVIGAQILDALEFPWAVKPAVRYHHERIDGSGYPEGLQGNEIPLPARIVAVADVMSAMITDRPYRRGLPPEEALAELTANAGVKYDAEAVDALCRVVEKGPL